MEYRIEQLARAAGVAVDTIRFYQGKGLLESPRREGRVTWYGDTHVERLKRIKELQQQGFTLTVIQRFLAGELEASDKALVAAVRRPSIGPRARRSTCSITTCASGSRPRAARPRPRSASSCRPSTTCSGPAARWSVITSSAACCARRGSTSKRGDEEPVWRNPSALLRQAPPHEWGGAEIVGARSQPRSHRSRE